MDAPAEELKQPCPHAETGRRIRAARDARGWRQEDLATRMDVRAITVSRWERGRFLPEVADFRRLADILGVSMDDLVPSNASALEQQTAEPADNAA